MSLLHRASALAIVTALACGVSAVQAQVVTDISGDGSTPTVVGRPDPTTYFIDGGTRSGDNLFHSFQGFNLGFGDLAVWLRSQGDGAQINHVINRVTGGDPSLIFGTLTTSGMPNASFWFINPAGIVFGQGASISVPNAAYFSTAQELRFGDGAVFSTPTPTGSTFSMADPRAFGFLGGQGDILVSGVTSDFAQGPLSLSAANVGIFGSQFLAYGLDVAAVGGGSAEVATANVAQRAVGDGTLLFENSFIDSFDTDRDINLAGGVVLVRSDTGGRISTHSGEFNDGGDLNIAAGLLEVSGRARLVASSSQGGPFGRAGGDINISAEQLLVLDGGQIETSTLGPGAGGNILIEAGSIIVAGQPDPEDFTSRSAIQSFAFGEGDAGFISIETGSLRVADGGFIGSDSEIDATGAAGGVGIFAQDVEIVGGGLISSNTYGRGAGGLVSIASDRLFLADGGTIASSTISPFEGAGDAGLIELRIGNLTIADGGLIVTSTSGPGQGGAIDIDAIDVTIRGSGTIESAVGPGATGNAGAILITAQSLNLIDNLSDDPDVTGGIIANSSGPGAGGLVEIVVDQLSMQRGAILANAFAEGDAGAVLIDARTVDMNGGLIQSSTAGSGEAGTISVVADLLSMTGDSSILSEAAAGTGNAGLINVEVGRLTMAENSTISSSTGTPGFGGFVLVTAGEIAMRSGASILSVTVGDGDAGDVLIEAGDLDMEDAEISSGSFGRTGNAGTVTIEARTIRLGDNGRISSSTDGAGAAGSVSVAADRLTLLAGGSISSNANGLETGNAGSVLVDAGELVIDGGSIESETFGTGNAGDVTIVADTIRMLNGGRISSAAFCADLGCLTSGNAGSITIQARSLDMTSGASVDTSTDGAGDAGDILVEAARITLSGSAIIASDANPGASGNAGTVEVRAAELTLDEGFISSETYGVGDAGDVLIVSNAIVMRNGATITSSAAECSDGSCRADGNAGFVTIETGTLDMQSGATIATVTSGAGDAGLIDISAQRLTMNDASINSSANLGSTGQAGVVDIRVGQFVMDNSSSVTSATLGAGDAGGVFIAVDDLVMGYGSEISSSAGICLDGSCVATGNAGAVQILAGTIDMGLGTGIRSVSFGPGDAGLVVIEADRLTMNEAVITSSVLEGSSGAAGLVFVQAGDLDMTYSFIESETFGSGRGGDVGVIADVLRMREGSRISSSSLGCINDGCDQAGDAGSVAVQARLIEMSDYSSIESGTFSAGDAGAVSVAAGRLVLRDFATISSTTFSSGNAGSIDIEAGDIVLSSGGRIQSSQDDESGTGNAGSIRIVTDTLTVGRDPLDRLGITTSIFRTGQAGSINITAGTINLDGGSIGSSARGLDGGRSGDVSLISDRLTMTDGARIETVSLNRDTAGSILVDADDILIQDGSRITSDNLSTAGGAAGSILLAANRIRLLDGGEVSSNSSSGAAGDIELVLPDDGFLQLAGADRPGIITTSSGPGTGGRIIIGNPFLVLSEGGRILALGQEGGANVLLTSAFFIRSADRLNLVSVDGSLIVDSQVGDLSSGTEAIDLSFLDASAVLRGQCSGADDTGRTSRFSARPTGPFGAVEAPRQMDVSDPLPRMLAGGACS